MNSTASPRRYSTRVWILRLVCLVAVAVIVPLMMLVGCQGSLMYFPRSYGGATVADWKTATGGKVVDFETSQGRQRAFLQGNLEAPRNLWIVCSGNGSVALDWAEWLEANAPKEDAWLLVDFPGYGDCEGAPSPGTIRESLKAVVPAACETLGWAAVPDASRLRIFGHSLGAAACLMAASEFGIQRGVLIAPFTSTMEMSQVLTGLPLGFAVWHRYDNAARLAELAARGPGKVIILHGTDDEVIPVAMGRSLAAGQAALVELREVPGGRHNSIPWTHPEMVVRAMGESGEEDVPASDR